MPIIEAENVSIRYLTGDFKDIGIKEYVTRRLTGTYHVREFWAAVILPGRILFEMGGVERELALEALHVAVQKLPLKCKIIEESEI